ncbi:TetR/AcrR family transcriptional regulator [Streptomyces sp. A0642]|uniref:TetR/AcrR family transcriptional regulator n=1 Tax=Streptomyces sp. A0642 TaxID=2563100 RepID=UPI0010A21237|nr:TetR/AcrR family transcriptional regulator [Streptomyces sp. A0642]THA71666.1 TetR/AcrR family transcriptional regulator [Streptomyces sp. A0642]
MPTAREALLEAAHAALAVRPWPVVRMVDVAAAADVSRQTLYNEFGSKDGLARALLRHAADSYLAGVEGALGSAGATGDRLAATAAWTVRATRANALVRALLTGCWSERLPHPATLGPVRRPASAVPAQRRADAGAPTPADLLRQVGDRAVAALDEGRPPHEREALASTCELVLRLALSYALVPPPAGGPEDGVPLVRDVVERAAGAAP